MIKVSIVSKDGQVLCECKDKEIDCIYESEYQDGDKIIIHKGSAEFIAVQLDENVVESIIYAPSSTVQFEIPTGELKKGYAPEAFSGNAHRIKVLKATDEHFCNYEESEDSIVQMETARYPHNNMKDLHIPIIYADFFFVEAILKLKGSDFLIW